MITLSQHHLDDINAHGRDAFPEECCGAMLGVLEAGQKITTQLVRIENTSKENRHRRFEVTDQDYQALEAKAKAEKLTLLGFYHTHPNSPAVPSQTDLNYAWPFFSYIILSVMDAVPAEIFSYELDLDLGQFKEEKVIIK